MGIYCFMFLVVFLCLVFVGQIGRFVVGFSKTVIIYEAYCYFGENRRMVEKGLAKATDVCDHDLEKTYTERCFDILNGFELIFTRCINCHKIVSLEAKKFSDP